MTSASKENSEIETSMPWFQSKGPASLLLFVHTLLCCHLFSKMRLTLWNPMDCSPPGSSVQWDFPGKNSEAGCHFLLQGIFLTQGSNLYLLHFAGGFFTTKPPGKPLHSLSHSVLLCPLGRHSFQDSMHWPCHSFSLERSLWCFLTESKPTHSLIALPW